MILNKQVMMKNFKNMKYTYLLRNISYVIMISSILFRWFIMQKMDSRWGTFSYTIMSISLLTILIVELIIYTQKNKSK